MRPYPGSDHFLPGMLLAATIAGLAALLRHLSGLDLLSPMIGAILGGMILGNAVRLPAAVAPGLAFAARPLLRAGIVLLGFQLNLGDLAEVGAGALLVASASLALCFLGTLALGPVLGVAPALTRLIAAGTSICGASAIVAANNVVKGAEEDTTYALATVTMFGTISMLLLPAAGKALGLMPEASGIWIGATVHEVAQVTAAAFQTGEIAGQVGTVTKMFRVLLLVPVIALLALADMRGSSGPFRRTAIPWFVLGFALCAAIGSLIKMPDVLLGVIRLASIACLVTALAAMGLQTRLKGLAGLGWRPMVLGLASTVLITSVGLGLVMIVGF